MKNWQIKYLSKILLMVTGVLVCTLAGASFLVETPEKVTRTEGLTPRDAAALVIWWVGFFCCLGSLLSALKEVPVYESKDKSG